MNLAFYISGHGLGHAVRSIEVIVSLCAMRPDTGVTVCTWSPQWIFAQSVPEVPVRYSRTDLGLVQLDNLRFDLAATLDELEKIRAGSDKLIEEETDFLRQSRVDIIVCDAPFIPFEAAQSAGIPAVLFTNFTWDWIYSFYEGFDEMAAWIQPFYMKAALTLRLPFNGGMEDFPSPEDVPLVARKSALSKGEARRAVNFPADKPVFLVSFTELSLGEEAVARLEKLEDYLFVYKEPFHIEAPNFFAAEGNFTDLVRGADGVITKPGYSIVAECIANETPMLHTDRGEFAEYPRLVEGIEAYLRHAHIPSEELYRGNWSAYLEALLRAPGPPETTGADGAQVAAKKIIELMEAG